MRICVSEWDCIMRTSDDFQATIAFKHIETSVKETIVHSLNKRAESFAVHVQYSPVLEGMPCMCGKMTTQESNETHEWLHLRVCIDSSLGCKCQNFLFSVDLLGTVINRKDRFSFLFGRHALCATRHFE